MPHEVDPGSYRPLRTIKTRIAPVIAIFAVACGGEEPAAAPPPAIDPVDLTFAPTVGVDLNLMDKLPSGLYVQDLYLGSGLTVRPGSAVSVHYTGWLHDGTKFDSSREREPFPVTVGETSVIAGWTEGLVGMREGGRRKLVIPPDLAYGPEGRPPVIPQQATLVFSIEVMDVQ